MPHDLTALDDLIACPQCDTLHRAMVLPVGSRAYCQQCGMTLMTARPTAMAHVLSLALTAFILMLAAISFPFLEISAAGQSNTVSVIAAVFAFNAGIAQLLALAVAGFIILLPLLRLSAIIYAITPLVAQRRPYRGAQAAFALAETLRPWSMTEIFIIGVAIALVKVAGLATFNVGPAFWAFCGLVVISVIKDQLICRYSIWEALDPLRP